MNYVKAYFGFLIAFLVIDAVWINAVAMNLYERDIGELLKQPPSLLAALMFYLFYTAGVLLLAVKPALTAENGLIALAYGAILGGLAYGTYTVTNYAIIEGWTMMLVVTDLLWGAVITGVCAWIAYRAA